MKCTFGETRFQPKIKIPRKVLSRPKANKPSAAKALPKISPTYLEYTDQLVPNSNSMMIPVATPIPKVMAKIFNQKRVKISYCFLPVFKYNPSKITMIKPIPILKGG